MLGLMYAMGRGVPKDFDESARWKKMAAEQGLPLAQQEVGVMYSLSGQGVPHDDVLAYMWMTLASRGVQIGSLRDKLAARMTPQQIAEGERLAAQWKPSNK